MSDILAGKTDQEKLKQLMEERKRKASAPQLDFERMSEALKQRVVGQDDIIDEMCRVIRNRWKMNSATRKTPICVFMFLGPPGTGKTELATALASYIYGNDDALLQFKFADMDRHSAKTTFVGSNGIYQNSGPGKLTGALMTNPRRVVLFDEVDKAKDEFPEVYDLFLGLFGEGQLTDLYTNKMAKANEAIFILTSNWENDNIGEMVKHIVDPDERVEAIKKFMRERKAFRPEIIDRFDQVFAFSRLEGENAAAVAFLRFKEVAKSFGLELLQITPELLVDVVERVEKDGSLRNMKRFVEKLISDPCITAAAAGARKIRLSRNEGGVVVVEQAQ
jgi:ATP-dependent Clp protease ATP-binding subunit ClpC